jgi:hypothetical protein
LSAKFLKNGTLKTHTIAISFPIPFNGFDPTLSQAIYGGHWLRPAVIPKLKDWLIATGL